jgi:hypothetical protein
MRRKTPRGVHCYCPCTAAYWNMTRNTEHNIGNHDKLSTAGKGATTSRPEEKKEEAEKEQSKRLQKESSRKPMGSEFCLMSTLYAKSNSFSGGMPRESFYAPLSRGS